MKNINKRSFTLIELIITITLLGLILIPLGFMSMEFTKEIVYSRDLGVVEDLAKIEFAKINNLSFTDSSLADGTDTFTNNYEGYPYNLRRTVNFANSPTNTIKRVQVRIYPAGNTTDQRVNMLTYIANISFGAGSGTSVVGSTDANFLVVTGGAISGKNLTNVTLQNTSLSSSITIIQMTISFTGEGGINLQKVTIAGTDVFSGNANSGSTITLSPSATLSANTSYSNPVFLKFNKSLNSVTSLVFTMSDGSQTTNYSW